MNALPYLLRIALPLVATGLLGVTSASSGAESPLSAELVSIAKIWDAGPHNAFTDLVVHKDRWYCVFREATDHVSEDGNIRVLASDDGASWSGLALLSASDGDLRDPKISITPAGKLMLTTVLWTPEDSAQTHQSRVYFSADGKTWDGPHEIGDKNVWLWRTSWHKDQAYNVGYATLGERFARLYHSDNGRDFTTLVENLGVDNRQPNESALAWTKEGEALCLLRCEKPAIAQLGSALPPFRDWTWKPLDRQLGGPNLSQHESGQWIAAGRIDKPAPHTSVCWLDRDELKLVEICKLPSGGDNSYPGLVWHGGLLWMSYYSSHEGKASIYLAKLKVTYSAQ